MVRYVEGAPTEQEAVFIRENADGWKHDTKPAEYVLASVAAAETEAVKRRWMAHCHESDVLGSGYQEERDALRRERDALLARVHKLRGGLTAACVFAPGAEHPAFVAADRALRNDDAAGKGVG